VILVVVAALVLFGWVRSCRRTAAAPTVGTTTEAPAGTPSAPSRASASAPAAPSITVILDDGGTPAAAAPAVVNPVFVRTTWGSGPGQLGHELPQEANPEAPMSLTVDARGNVLVLDQVNQRLVRFGPDGQPAGTVRVDLRAAQDVATAADGTMAVLDRLGDRTVALLGPDGRERGRLPLEGANVPEGGGVTAVVVDGEDVYVEREHGPLVRIGDTAGRADEEREEIPGRPTRDGQSYINAGLVDPAAGRVLVNSVERPSKRHRFTRVMQIGLVVSGIVLLDTDRAGTIYLGVLGHSANDTSENPTPGVRLLCLDPLQGSVLGAASLPANTTPEETFRDFSVLDEGGVMYAERSAEGVTLRRYDCK
jgi:hypothetical protein